MTFRCSENDIFVDEKLLKPYGRLWVGNQVVTFSRQTRPRFMALHSSKLRRISRSSGINLAWHGSQVQPFKTIQNYSNFRRGGGSRVGICQEQRQALSSHFVHP